LKTGVAWLVVVAAAAASFWGLKARAEIRSGDKHDMTSRPGYTLSQSFCTACHVSHFALDDRLWTDDKEANSDGLRDLAPAKALSEDQSAGGNYPGIYLCLDCHGSPARPSWAAGMTTIKTHSTREMQAVGYGTKYGSFVVECRECHDPHKHWDGTFEAGANGYMIRETINTPNSGERTVVFRSMTGADSMGTNTSPYDSICEVCHTQTLFHRNAAGAASHNDGANCTNCHSHTGGFAATDCDLCHGYPPVSYDTLVGRPGNPGSPPTGSPTEGKHGFHVYTLSYNCATCHRSGMGDGESEDAEIDVRFKAFDLYTTGGFDGFTPISGYVFSANNTTGGALDCFGTYCHGNFNGGITTNRPVWNNAATGDCGTCHGTAPPTLQDHSVHLTANWGPRAACDDCHAAGSNTGSHADHVNGNVRFRDGQDLAGTTVCNSCHGVTASTKPTWGVTTNRPLKSWCESCHDGSSTVNTQAGTGGLDIQAPNVVGNAITYGFDVTGHGKTGITIGCTDICHTPQAGHIDGVSPTYTAANDDYKDSYRLYISNTVPILGDYTSTAVELCFSCHREDRVLGMPAEGKPSALHVHSVIPSDKWYTNFRNTSTAAGLLAGNWDITGGAGYAYDVPTNIHWNHIDDYGSNKRGEYLSERLYDSDGDGSGDSNIMCETCHSPHGTRYPAMTLEDFSMMTFSVLINGSVVSHAWLNSSQYVTTRCTDACHLNGDASGTAGTRWYRKPLTESTVFGVPLDLKVEPMP